MKHDPHEPGDTGKAVKRTGGAMFVLAWLVLLALMFTWFSSDEERRINPNASPETLEIDGTRTLVLQANRQNHFVTTGMINGREALLLLDTGATNVAVPANLGARLGLERGEPGYAYTANGRVKVYSTRIDTLQIGEIVLRDVAADLNPGMNRSEAVLLGMSALSQVQFTQRDGKLYISQ